jgi:HEAT repeat protein
MASQKKRRSPTEVELDALRTVTSAPTSPETIERLRAALRSPHSLVVAYAATHVREHALEGFGDDLEASFRSFMSAPAKSDPGCRARLATLEALDYGEHRDSQPFLAATRAVQMEAAWGPPVDTAVGLRSRGVLALSRLDHPDLPIIAGALLGDAESPVRQAAADALAASQHRSSAGLLLLRWAMGDDDPLVILACMSGVLALAPEEALPKLRGALSGADRGDREAAALALGQSKRDDALDALLEALAHSPEAVDRATILRAVGLHRSDRALNAVLDVVATGRDADAEAAVVALAPRRFDPGARARVEQAARRNEHVRLDAAIRSTFGSDETGTTP